MTGSNHGITTQLQAEESQAVLTHCYGRSLNLATGDTTKQSKVCRDALDMAFEISKLIRFSPKRNAAFDHIKVENSADDEVLDVGIRAFVQQGGLFMRIPFRALLTTTLSSSSSGMSALTRDLIQMSKAGSLASRLKCHGTVFSLVYTSAKKH
jgi:hypothetical protein